MTGIVARTLSVVLVAVALAGCAGMTPSDARSAGSAGVAASRDPGLPTPKPTVIPVPKHEVYGFVPYWEMDGSIADHIGRTELTTLALFSVTHRRNGRLDNQTGLRRIRADVGRDMIRAARRQGARVEIVYTSFGSAKNRAFYGDPKAQERWLGEIVGLVEELDLDGINVDVEALPIDLVADYGAFVGRLRTALRERVPEAQVSVATQANEVGASMAAAAAMAGADRIFLMGYDYRWAGSEPGASAPLDRMDGKTKDLLWSLDLYGALGVPSDRLILGLPLYGVTWPVIGPGFLAPSSGRGDPWVPRRNLRVFSDPAFAPTYEPTESVEWYAIPTATATVPQAATVPGGSASATTEATAWNAVYFDSPRSLTPKLRLADERGLAGAGFWAIGYERGLPGYTELIAAFRAGDLPRE
ncbi:MAG TPA: glycosyl hydrolase family 18 protein [Candidatus Limnocylindrales bacterium]|nr:glycosyl hydrolase family 18 protein [Candidatus Limnocylindrales bacterium]